MPDYKMGSDDNITNKTFEELAKKLNKSLEETKLYVLYALENQGVDKDQNLKGLFEKTGKSWGQKPEEAKREVLQMLMSQLQK